MNDLLTSREVQNLLKVDRITVYRMLNDGRLQGVKIGQQWRFHRAEVERMLINHQPGDENSSQPVEPSSFPTHCVQTIQDLFSDVSGIAAVVVDMTGSPLTRASNPVGLAALLLDQPAGRAMLRSAWTSFAQASLSGGKFFTCPAGLQYTGAPVLDQGRQVALFLAGGFFWNPPDPREQAARVRRLANELDLPLDQVQSAAEATPVIDPTQHERVEAGPLSAACAIQSILRERVGFVERLQQIANLTQLA